MKDHGLGAETYFVATVYWKYLGPADFFNLDLHSFIVDVLLWLSSFASRYPNAWDS